MIEDGLARAEKTACVPAAPRCYNFPDPREEARQTCTPKGRYLIGWIVANSGRVPDTSEAFAFVMLVPYRESDRRREVWRSWTKTRYRAASFSGDSAAAPSACWLPAHA
jgi:hypothetical protein